jgi:hypothetical protein
LAFSLPKEYTFTLDGSAYSPLSSHFDLNKEWGAGIGLSGTRNDTTEQKSALLELSVSYRF